MKPKAYNKVIHYEFEVDGIDLQLEVIRDGASGISGLFVEETHKNGQEDCHMSGELIFNLTDDLWEWESESFSEPTNMGSQKLADGIVKYINKHGVPS